MPRYANGFIPDHELVLIEGNHKATRGTAARWEMLKADVLANEGIRLRITGGENAYRSFAGQVFARQNACAEGRCNDAAVPGTSSHGGSLNGRDSGAIDVNNWADIGLTKFSMYCRRNGFEPGYFDWEPWHIIDWAPYTLPAGGGNSTPENPETPEEEEEEEMAMKGLAYKRSSDGATIVAKFNEISGFYQETEGTTGDYNTPIAQAWEIRGAEANGGSWPLLSESDVMSLKRSLAEVRQGK